MLTVTLPDGTVVSWDTSSATPAAFQESSSDSMTSASSTTSVPVDTPAVAPTEENVQSALNAAPPKWVATAWRFTKGLLAGFASAFTIAFATAGGTVEGVMHDPARFFGALATGIGTGFVLAIDKFLKWKE
jgi:hypothetical protein